MKLFFKTLALSAGFLLSAHGFAQTSTATPAAKPAASSSVPAVSNGPTMAKPATSAPTDATTSSPMKKATKPTSDKMPATAAVGGGDGKVWVNTASKTYHCAGSKYYGKTKAGEYMSEADAKAKGNHPNHKKACS